MNDAVAALKASATSALTQMSFLVEAPLTARAASEQEINEALQLGRAQFDQLNALLKRALDTQDLEVFTQVEREWSGMFENTYLPDDQDEQENEFAMASGEVAAKLAVIRQLARYREVMWLGLAMWAAHLHEKQGAERPQNMWVDALRILSQHFSSVERLLAVYQRASEGEDQDRVPWSDWFLAELPPRQAHWMPTQAELLFTTVLLSAMLIGTEPPALTPQPWIRWRGDEVEGALQRLADGAAVWSVVIPAPALDTGLVPPDLDALAWWRRRLDVVREMFNRLKDETEADELDKIRNAPLDSERVGTFRRNVLAATRQARLVHDLFQVQATVEQLDSPPEGPTPMVSRSWLPKSYFTPDSDVIGLDWVAGDLARVTSNWEIQSLLTTLEGTSRAGQGSLLASVKAAIRELSEQGRRPSLIVIPIGWDLRRVLDLPPRRATVRHTLIPLGRTRDFQGVIDGVPVIDFPHVPSDRLWVLDLAEAATMREWPSDENSGLTFELREFNAEQAKELLAEHPEVRQAGQGDIEAIRSLQERVLLTLTICWDINQCESGASVQIAVPEDLRPVSSADSLPSNGAPT